jgi:hypothetical protein
MVFLRRTQEMYEQQQQRGMGHPMVGIEERCVGSVLRVLKSVEGTPMATVDIFSTVIKDSTLDVRLGRRLLIVSLSAVCLSPS